MNAFKVLILILVFATTCYSQIEYKVKEEKAGTYYDYDILTDESLIDWNMLRPAFFKLTVSEGFAGDTDPRVVTFYQLYDQKYAARFYIISIWRKGHVVSKPSGMGSMYISLTYEKWVEPVTDDEMAIVRKDFKRIGDKLIAILNQCLIKKEDPEK